MKAEVTTIEPVVVPMQDIAVASNGYAGEASDALSVIHDFQITTPDELAVAVQMTAEVKAHASRIEAARVSLVKPLMDVVARLNAMFKPTIEKYLECETILKGRIQQFRELLANERQRLLEEAEEQAQGGDTVAAAQAIFDAENYVVPKVAGYTERTDWVGEVVDANKIPREYLVPDLKKLLAVTKATKGDPKIPGWRAFSKQVSSVKFGGR